LRGNAHPQTNKIKILEEGRACGATSFMIESAKFG
jgi:hypothetical protein